MSPLPVRNGPTRSRLKDNGRQPTRPPFDPAGLGGLTLRFCFRFDFLAIRHGAPFRAAKYVRYESGWRDEFDYDKNGNRKSDPNGSFEYTADNRVERIFVDDLHWSHFDYGPLDPFAAGNLLLSSSTSVGLSGSVNGTYNVLGAAYFSAYSCGFVPSDYGSNTVGYKWQQLQTSNGSWSPF
jgi:hypothetical protein